MSVDRPAGTRHVEHRTVSRKTPGDGKLEITKAAAATIAVLGGTQDALGGGFPLVLVAPGDVGRAGDDRTGEARVGTMPCTCRGDDRPHVHYFVESDLLRALPAGSEVDLLLDEHARRLLVVPA